MVGALIGLTALYLRRGWLPITRGLIVIVVLSWLIAFYIALNDGLGLQYVERHLEDLLTPWSANEIEADAPICVR